MFHISVCQTCPLAARPADRLPSCPVCQSLQRRHFLIAQNFRHHPTHQTIFLFFSPPNTGQFQPLHSPSRAVRTRSKVVPLKAKVSPPPPPSQLYFWRVCWCRGGLPAGSPRASSQPGGQSREGGRGCRGSRGQASDRGMLGGSREGRERGVIYCWQQQQPEGVTVLLATAVLMQ